METGERQPDGLRTAAIHVPIEEQALFACAAAAGALIFAERYFTWAGWRDSEWQAVNPQLGRNLFSQMDELNPLPD